MFLVSCIYSPLYRMIKRVLNSYSIFDTGLDLEEISSPCCMSAEGTLFYFRFKQMGEAALTCVGSSLSGDFRGFVLLWWARGRYNTGMLYYFWSLASPRASVRQSV